MAGTQSTCSASLLSTRCQEGDLPAERERVWGPASTLRVSGWAVIDGLRPWELPVGLRGRWFHPCSSEASRCPSGEPWAAGKRVTSLPSLLEPQDAARLCWEGDSAKGAVGRKPLKTLQWAPGQTCQGPPP